jgi:hypothetical protein
MARSLITLYRGSMDPKQSQNPLSMTSRESMDNGNSTVRTTAAVSHNRASGNAIQICGHVAGSIQYMRVKNFRMDETVDILTTPARYNITPCHRTCGLSSGDGSSSEDAVEAPSSPCPAQRDGRTRERTNPAVTSPTLVSPSIAKSMERVFSSLKASLDTSLTTYLYPSSAI